MLKRVKSLLLKNSVSKKDYISKIKSLQDKHDLGTSSIKIQS